MVAVRYAVRVSPTSTASHMLDSKKLSSGRQLASAIRSCNHHEHLHGYQHTRSIAGAFTLGNPLALFSLFSLLDVREWVRTFKSAGQTSLRIIAPSEYMPSTSRMHCTNEAPSSTALKNRSCGSRSADSSLPYENNGSNGNLVRDLGESGRNDGLLPDTALPDTGVFDSAPRAKFSCLPSTLPEFPAMASNCGGRLKARAWLNDCEWSAFDHPHREVARAALLMHPRRLRLAIGASVTCARTTASYASRLVRININSTDFSTFSGTSSTHILYQSSEPSPEGLADHLKGEPIFDLSADQTDALFFSLGCDESSSPPDTTARLLRSPHRSAESQTP
eukprot:3326652-Rhodomonas_salina.3